MWKEMKWYINVEKDVATILKENGVDVDGGAIESVIWSRTLDILITKYTS